MEEKRQRGRYCVAGTPNQQSCQNRSFTPGIRMYQFPADPAVRAKWVQFVRRHRHDFKNPTSKYTSLCSAHFEDSCYERTLSVLSSMETAGMKVKYCLKKDAIPTTCVQSIHRRAVSLTHWQFPCSNGTLANLLHSRLCILYIGT